MPKFVDIIVQNQEPNSTHIPPQIVAKHMNAWLEELIEDNLIVMQ